MSMRRKVAFVTGASRGIGRASALALAEKGFDVVVTARTVREGEGADSLPGSIETTAAEVEALGQRALPLRIDLQDRASMQAAVAETVARWGHIDVLLNNAIYKGAASMQLVLDLDLEEVRRLFEANVIAQTYLIQQVLPGMLQRDSGLVLNMVSGSAVSDPPAPAGQGGWGFAYAASKAALLRMVGVLAVEHADSSVRFMNVDPGLVLTESMRAKARSAALLKYHKPAPMEVPASAIAWLATDADAAKYNGRTVDAQPLCLELGLQPDWRHG